MFHKLVYLDGIVVFMLSVNGQADGADESFVFTIGIDADEGGVLPMGVAVVGFDKIFEAL